MISSDYKALFIVRKRFSLVVRKTLAEHMKTLRLFASLKLTLIGMGILVLGASLMYGNPTDMSIWVVVLPLMLLAVNLIAAILTNPRINENPGLLLFHVSLLSMLLLAAIGRMTHLDAQVEMLQGSAFDAAAIMDVRLGPFHDRQDLAQLQFRQGPYTVQYAAGLRRGLTHSYVQVKRGKRWLEQVVGDDRPLIIDGYRFYTTFNKGFSALMTWTPKRGEAITGVINMPSYPLFDYKQDNLWAPPGEDPIKFWLRLSTGMDENAAWVLDGREASGVLVVNTGQRRIELEVGQSMQLSSGQLRFDEMSVWMGYRIYYDPTIQWMFFVSVFGVLGLAHFLWKKINLQPWLAQETLGSPEETVEGNVAIVDASPINAGSNDIGVNDIGVNDASATNSGPANKDATHAQPVTEVAGKVLRGENR
ncbi:MAG: cytochrome c biogenesis protein ResB [Thiohalomonadales bacterium]